MPRRNLKSRVLDILNEQTENYADKYLRNVYNILYNNN